MKNFDGDREGVDENSATLEHLLRLKRHERPPDEFWEDFEVVLKTRTLQSVVRKKSWFGVGGFRSHVFNAWIVRLSVGLAVLAIAMYFAPLAEENSVVDLDVVPPSFFEVSSDESVVITTGIEAPDEVEFIDGAITLSNSVPAEFHTAFPSNDLHAVSSDTITYAEENLTSLFAESEPSDLGTIF